MRDPSHTSQRDHIDQRRRDSHAGEVRGCGRKHWRTIEIDQRTYGELRGMLNHYWSHLLGRQPRLQRYLGTAAS